MLLLKRARKDIWFGLSGQLPGTINKIDKFTYGFSFEYKTEKDGVNVTAEAFKGTVKFEKKDPETVNINLVIDNVPDVGKVTLNMELKNSENVNIEDVNTSNSVDINSMKTEDFDFN